MRVPDSSHYRAITGNLTTLAARHAEAARTASSGLRVTSPGSDPRGAAEVARLRHALERSDGFRQNIGAAHATASLGEGVLAEGSAILEQVLELAIQAANGSMSASERAQAGQQVASLTAQLLSIANTRGPEGYLFAGSQTNTEPFDSNGGFVANTEPHVLEIGPQLVANVRLDGARAFTAAGGTDVFGALASLQTALQADDQGAIVASLDGIRAAHRQVVGARASAGILMDRLRVAESALDQTELALKVRKASVSEADAASAFTELYRTENAIQQAISVARRTLNLNRFEP
jgi:flagellar hook-associated protein 3 FlgL